MSNPLYNQMQSNNIFQRFMEFRKSFSGNAQEQVQNLLNSGRITQQQYDQAVRTAQQFQRILNGK